MSAHTPVPALVLASNPLPDPLSKGDGPGAPARGRGPEVGVIRNVWPLVGAATMRALDQHTIETIGVRAGLLMESAGRAVTEAVLEQLPPGGRVVVVCGTGNNGGDGLVAARHLAVLGVPVQAVFPKQPDRLHGDPAENLERARKAGVEIQVGLTPERLAACDVAVDAIFGTGLTRDVEGEPAKAIRLLSERPDRVAVVAVDLPSGLHADTGQPLGEAVRADVTVTIGLPKLGLALSPGREIAGAVRVARIGIADEAPGVELRESLWTRAAAGERLPERPASAHKGRFGHVLLVAASEGKTGAAALAAQGALRAGAGLVTVACPSGLNDVLEVKCTEAMTAPLPETPERCLSEAAEKPVLELAEARSAVGLGPGLTTHPQTVSLVRKLCEALDRPLVIDADGLNALAGATEVLRRRRAPTVLTPHPGEAARLTSGSPGELNRDRVGAARRLAQETGAVVVLKGAATVAADPDGRVIVNPTGGPGLASGGTGDVLTGAVTAMLAQGLPALEAAALAAFLHGYAADRLSEIEGPSGLIAGDVADAMPESAQMLREIARSAGAAGVLGARLAVPFPEP